MNGRIFGGKPLYVGLAQRKEDRKAHLQQQYMQRVSTGIRMQVKRHIPFRKVILNQGFHGQPGCQPKLPAPTIHPADYARSARPDVPSGNPNGSSYSQMGSTKPGSSFSLSQPF
jgi:hypothetical protein